MRLVALFLTAFAVLTPAAHAQVSIRTTPAIPVEGASFELRAASAGSGVAYSWDLDGDGVFGDATGPGVSQVWPAGTRTVGVRATDASGRTSTETRTVTAASTNYPPTIEHYGASLTEVGRPTKIVASSWEQDGRIESFEFDLDGDGTYERQGTFWHSELQSWFGWADATFSTPGDHRIGVRVTDDKGASAIGTAIAHVTDSEPSAALQAYGETFTDAPVAGEPTTISATSARAAAHYEFDLDGDGVYELDKGATGQFTTTLNAGTHVLGVRITDPRGGVTEQRITTFVYDPADTFVDKVFVRRLEPTAVAGEPIDLKAYVEPYSYSYTVEWDADGDGQFDDGTFTTPGNIPDSETDGAPDSSLAHNVYTYAAPGVYDQRVRVSRVGLPTRVFTSRVFVGTRTIDRTPLPSLRSYRATPFGAPVRLYPSLSWVDGRDPNAVLSWDLDGDGEFDDTPRYNDTAYEWTFTAPVTIALKATERSTGATSIVTAQVQPPGGNATPVVSLDVSGATASYTVDPANGASCCAAEWDTDGDGAYDDGTGKTAPVPTSAGEHSVGLKVTDGAGRVAVVRRTFPVAAETVPAAERLTLTLTVHKTKLKALLAHGLKVRPGCSVACRATVVLADGKAKATQRKPARQLGKATGKSRTITVKLTAKAKRSLRHAKSVKLQVAVTATATDGRAGTAGRAVKVRR
jgi:hypothetical protein